MRNIGIACLGLAILPMVTLAQEQPKPTLWNTVKQHTTAGGYVIGKFAANDNEQSNSNSSFDLRLIRAYVKGNIAQWSYMLQAELNGVSGTKAEKGPRIIDAWVMWKPKPYIGIKAGQMKRTFTFENPMNPWNIGATGYAFTTTQFAGMSDRVGEHTSGGRDIGVVLTGDILKSKHDNHYYLHYQGGVYNGQGINHADLNQQKDVLGGISVEPIKNLQFGVFGWTGSYTSTVDEHRVTVDRNRWAVGVNYDAEYTFRAEYVASQGHKTADYSFSADGDVTIKNGDHADAWYVLAGVPLTRQAKVYAKWDVYRDQKTRASQTSVYSLTADYYIFKNLKLQAMYSLTENELQKDHYVNSGEIQLYFRF